jgi:hypothetical protein
MRTTPPERKTKYCRMRIDAYATSIQKPILKANQTIWRAGEGARGRER